MHNTTTKSITTVYPEVKNLSHQDKYDFLIDKIGFEILKTFIKVDDEKLKKAYKKDKTFNSIKLKRWNEWAKFGLRNLIENKTEINYISQSECVCLLKAVARRIVKNEA